MTGSLPLMVVDEAAPWLGWWALMLQRRFDAEGGAR